MEQGQIEISESRTIIIKEIDDLLKQWNPAPPNNPAASPSNPDGKKFE